MVKVTLFRARKELKEFITLHWTAWANGMNT
jgi:hypothetical protein